MPGKNKMLTPQETVQILMKHGTTVTLEEAELMLELLCRFAKVSLDSVLNERNEIGSM
jgi:hypothetical protein